MAIQLNPFRRKAPDDDAVRQAVRGWVTAALNQPEGLELTISEVDCADPACPGRETFILAMRAGEATQAARIAKPLAAVTAADIIAAVRHL